MRVRLVFLTLTLVLAIPKTGRTDPTRALMISSAYGILAGTLVGAATLAFTQRPGDNLRNIARGASLGLYSGILLGLYVVYLVPDAEDESEEEAYPMEEEPITRRTIVYPLIGERGQIEGAAVNMKVLTF